jgi:hypothetical protein
MLYAILGLHFLYICKGISSWMKGMTEVKILGWIF